MASRKRGRAEMEAAEPQKAPSLLTQLRNTWEFSNLMQFIYIFGKALKIDEDFDIEDLEDECMKPEPSHKLAELGLCLLKFISSQRGLTTELFDEHTRRQYLRRSPQSNPFGDDVEPKRFVDFDVFTKLGVLVQLSHWVFVFTDRLREKMNLKETEQLDWRVTEVGWDSDERIYYVLDDNRLYRRTDPDIPPAPQPKPKPKAKAKAKAKAKKPTPGTRSSKRRKTAEEDEVHVEDEEAEADGAGVNGAEDHQNNTYTWECVAVTLEEYHHFLDTIKKSKHPDEKALHKYVSNEVLPVIEKLEEDRQKKIAKRQRELLNMEKMAHAKRSSRIATKHEREQQEAEAKAAEDKRKADLAGARKEAEKQKHMEEARQSRMKTREQRHKEREAARILHEEELRKLSEDSEKIDSGEARLSERHLKAEMAKRQKELEEIQEEDDWYFDCAKCGVHGENIDDGSHSVACDRCNVWQHSACLGISQTDAEKEDFHFICDDCKLREEQAKRREEDAKKPKIAPLKFKFNRSPSPPETEDEAVKLKVNPSSSSPAPGEQIHLSIEPSTQSSSSKQENASKKRKSQDGESAPGMPPLKRWKPPPVGVHSTANGVNPTANGVNKSSSMHQAFMKGPTLTPHGQHTSHHGINGTQNGPPPGLISPTRPTSQASGSKPNGAPIGIFSSSMQSIIGQTTNKITAHPSLPGPSPNVGQRSPPPSAPKANFQHSDQQTPAPPQRSSFTTPTSNGVTAHTSPYLKTPSTNLPPSSAAAPSLQPGFSPQKPMQSSPPTPALHSPSLHGSSSPKIAPPASDPQAAGFSPSKNEPPRPSSNHGLNDAPTLKPMQQLTHGFDQQSGTVPQPQPQPGSTPSTEHSNGV